MTFEEYVLDWWYGYLDQASDETLKAVMGDFIPQGATMEEYIPKEAESAYDWLMANVTDADEIYGKYYGSDRKHTCHDNMPDTFGFVYPMLKENASWYDGDRETLPSFAEDFLRDMASHIEDYTNPIDFFADLQHGGCESGLIGKFVHNSDCKDFYLVHIDDMEVYVEDIYDEVGYIKNRNGIRHYVFICWLCYEEFAFQLARALFPEQF